MPVRDPDATRYRWLVVSEVLQAQGQKIMDSIGHPIDAFNEAKPYRDAADDWKHWATVKARHMLGLPSRSYADE